LGNLPLGGGALRGKENFHAGPNRDVSWGMPKKKRSTPKKGKKNSQSGTTWRWERVRKKKKGELPVYFWGNGSSEGGQRGTDERDLLGGGGGPVERERGQVHVGEAVLDP